MNKFVIFAFNGIPFGEDMNGHPSMAAYMDKGYQIITL